MCEGPGENRWGAAQLITSVPKRSMRLAGGSLCVGAAARLLEGPTMRNDRVCGVCARYGNGMSFGWRCAGWWGVPAE